MIRAFITGWPVEHSLSPLIHGHWLKRHGIDGSYERLAKSPELDTYLRPLEEGLDDLPELKATPEGATRLRHGNPGMVLASDVEYGDEAWASFDGKAVAVGIYRSGELHPSRVFNQ